MVNHVHTIAMGYTIFSVGDHVRITSGEFSAMEGVVAAPTLPHEATATLIAGQPSMLFPVTVVVEGGDRTLVLRIAPELLQRV